MNHSCVMLSELLHVSYKNSAPVQCVSFTDWLSVNTFAFMHSQQSNGTKFLAI